MAADESAAADRYKIANTLVYRIEQAAFYHRLTSNDSVASPLTRTFSYEMPAEIYESINLIVAQQCGFFG